MRAGRFLRLTHRVHRWVGSALALPIALWFASGAVMTFSGFPYYSEQERLATARPLPSDAAIAMPSALQTHVAGGGLAQGARVRLALLEGQPTWLFQTVSGRRVALRATGQPEVAALDAARVTRELEARLALPVRGLSRIDEPDQWTVAFAKPALLPLFRAELGDGAGSVAYMSAASGEVLQLCTRRERLLAWLGAIPHWIYPTVLRREGELWRSTVLVLSGTGLVVSLSGSLAGLHVWRSTRKRGIRDPYLRWHQWLGLWFGLLASSWLFSGALSLAPFHWSGGREPRRAEQTALYGAAVQPAVLPVGDALRRCQRELRVVELELAALGARVYAVCSDASQRTRLVDLADPALSPRARLSDHALRELAQRLAPGTAPPTAVLERAYDAYHYPTHTRPAAALPYARLTLADAARTTFYVDPQRARLIRRLDARTRLERWLYQGLHSLDFPGFYTRPWLWRGTLVACMALGLLLSGLGLGMALRRLVRRAHKAPRRSS